MMRGEWGVGWGGGGKGTHGWLNPSPETPSSRQGAHTFPSFSLQDKESEAMREFGGQR